MAGATLSFFASFRVVVSPRICGCAHPTDDTSSWLEKRHYRFDTFKTQCVLKKKLLLKEHVIASVTHFRDILYYQNRLFRLETKSGKESACLNLWSGGLILDLSLPRSSFVIGMRYWGSSKFTDFPLYIMLWNITRSVNLNSIGRQ